MFFFAASDIIIDISKYDWFCVKLTATMLPFTSNAFIVINDKEEILYFVLANEGSKVSYYTDRVLTFIDFSKSPSVPLKLTFSLGLFAFESMIFSSEFPFNL